MAGLVDGADRLAQVAELARGGSIRDGAEDVLALQLEEIADLVEQIGDTRVLFGGVLARHSAMLASGGSGRAPASRRPRRCRRGRGAPSSTRPRRVTGRHGHRWTRAGRWTA